MYYVKNIGGSSIDRIKNRLKNPTEEKFGNHIVCAPLCHRRDFKRWFTIVVGPTRSHTP